VLQEGRGQHLVMRAQKTELQEGVRLFVEEGRGVGKRRWCRWGRRRMFRALVSTG